MPIFRKKDQKIYLITNYKVMYSTLKHQKNLQRIHENTDFSKLVIQNRLFYDRSKFYFIVRNPYDRVESFFKEKFRASLNYYDRFGMWLDSQELFFPYLGIEKGLKPEIIKEKLHNFSFNEFMILLPEVYMQDAHLHPQYLKTIVSIKKWGLDLGLRIRVKKVFKIECERDLNEIRDIFKINLGLRKNSTAFVEEELNWTTNNLKIVEELYVKDFKLFNYPIKGI